MPALPLVVSLTSIPPRFAQLPRVIAALRAQSLPPARILVTLPRHYRRFPGRHAAPALPGAEILRPEHDAGPLAKVAEAARALRGQACALLYCDDDWLYQPRWAERFVAAARARPDCVIAGACFGVRRLGLPGAPDTALIAQGFAGVLIRPDWLDDAALTPPAGAWAVDDIWLSAHYARAGRQIWQAPGLRALARPLADPARLQDAVIGGQNRATANHAMARALADRFEIWDRPQPLRP